jgi:Transposase DDE domain
VTFGAACRGCPLRSRCTTAAAGRTLQLHPRDHLLRAARAQWAADPALRADYKNWPNVERAIAQIATSRGRGIKLRYRGVARNNAWLSRRTAAVNLRNMISRGLTRQAGAWTLAAS